MYEEVGNSTETGLKPDKARLSEKFKDHHYEYIYENEYDEPQVQTRRSITDNQFDSIKRYKVTCLQLNINNLWFLILENVLR